MNLVEAQQFLRGLGCYKIGSTLRKGIWLAASCPLAPWKHQKHTDVHPSFVIAIRPGDRSWCVCHSCGFRGDPMSLVIQIKKNRGFITERTEQLARNANLISIHRVQEETRQITTRVLTTLQEEPSFPRTRELGGIEVPWGVYFGNFENLPAPFTRADISHLTEKIPAEVMAWLQGPERNLTKKSIMDWDLGYHEPSGRVTIPVVDCKQRLINVTGRALFGAKTPKWFHGFGFRSEMYLFGEDRVVKGRRGYLFEGNFDPIYFNQLGYLNGVGLMGTTLSPLKLEKIKQWFPEVYIALDPDAAGKAGTLKAVQLLSGVVPFQVIHMPADVDLLSLETCWSLFGSPYR